MSCKTEITQSLSIRTKLLQNWLRIGNIGVWGGLETAGTSSFRSEKNFHANRHTPENRTFAGQVLDSETGLMHHRNRYYHIVFGKFGSRDPIGYSARDVSLYRYVMNNSRLHIDSMGLYANPPRLNDAEKAWCRKNPTCCQIALLLVRLVPVPNAKTFHYRENSSNA